MTLVTIGGITLIIAGICALVVGIDAALRLGGEGMLFGIGMGAISLVPFVIGSRMLDAPEATVLTVAAWALAFLLVLLAMLSIAMMVTGEPGGFVMIGVALALGGALYAIAPAYIESRREAAAAVTRARSPTRAPVNPASGTTPAPAPAGI